MNDKHLRDVPALARPSNLAVAGTHSNSGRQIVQRVEALIWARPGATFSTECLTRAAGVSRRTLHRCFERQCGYGPMEAVRRARLSAVRSELLHAVASTSVTDVAMKFGFFHLGRFSGLYFSRYGELPSSTLRHSRRGASVRAARTKVA